MKNTTYSRHELEAYVTACGVTPEQNYLLLKKEPSSVKLIGAILVGRAPKNDAERDARGDDYLMVCAPTEFYLVNLSNTPAPTDIAFRPRRVPLTAVQSFKLQRGVNKYTLQLTMGGVPESYNFQIVRPEEDAYLLANWRTLLAKGFYGITVSAEFPSATTGAPQPKQRIQTPPSAPQHTTPTSRPERKRESLLQSLLGKPKRS